MRNLYTDEIRRRRSRGEEQVISEQTDLQELITPPADNGTIRDFVKVLRILSVEHREILLLVSVEELNYREIADALDIPIGTVMSRLARARERLRSARQGEAADVIALPLGSKEKPREIRPNSRKSICTPS